jgi:signal transduction histidine kinase
MSNDYLQVLLSTSDDELLSKLVHDLRQQVAVMDGAAVIVAEVLEDILTQHAEAGPLVAEATEAIEIMQRGAEQMKTMLTATCDYEAHQRGDGA